MFLHSFQLMTNVEEEYKIEKLNIFCEGIQVKIIKEKNYQIEKIGNGVASNLKLNNNMKEFSIECFLFFR